MTRTRLAIAFVVAATLPASSGLRGQSPTYDVVIRGGHVLDGNGNPWSAADVGIRNGRIAAVGRLDNAQAAHVIDAGGRIVAPGFIDLHTHSDLSVLADPLSQSKVRQGVTLDVLGESTSVAPRDGLTDAPTDGVTQDWTTFTDYFARVESTGVSINLISHVSAEQVRRVVMGYESRPATPAEIERMKQLVARSMEEGAWGLVTRYESGGPEHPREILEMAKVVASYGGNYTSHIGSEGFEQEKELAFAIRVAQEARLPVHVFHLKIRARDNWGTVGKYLKMIDDARARGLDITANQYPYTAMNHGWSAFFPVWAREGGPAKFAERLKDPAVRERIKKDKDFITWAKEHGWWDGIVMGRAGSAPNRKYEGMRLSEIAKARGDSDPADTCLTLMAEDGGRISGMFHTMSEDDVRLVMKQPWVAIASDGSAINLDAPGVPHPRNYSTNVRVLGYYVREQHVLSLEEAVRKMTSLPAQILGLRDRGQLREGFAADVVVFDPATVGETNSFEKPKSFAKGVDYVLVNGTVVIDKGRHTGATPGRAIRSAAAAQHSTNGEQDKKEVRAVFERYLESVKTADPSLASRIWLQSSDVVAVTPFGRFQGWDSVRNDLYIKFLHDSFTERNLQGGNVAIRVMGNAAWLVMDWTFSGKLQNGQVINSKGWETHVYEKVGSTWRISHLHYSVPPPMPTP
jgi:dihydroorotase/N-acyl-D-amino-acid deacylase